MLWSIQTFRLASNPVDPGLFCSKDELTLGGVPLLEKTELGFRPCRLDDLQRAFDAAYGCEASIDAEDRLPGLQSIADALDLGDMSRASMLSLMLRLPDIDPNGMLRLRKISNADITKYSDDEPRDWHGRWTTGGQGAEGPKAKPPANSSITGRIKPTAFHLTGRSPDTHRNNPNIVPAQAIPLPLFPPPIGGGSIGGSPKPKDDGLIFPAPDIPQTGANDNAATQAQALNDNIPRACPDPSYEPDSVKRTPLQLEYQAQISGLPPGMGVMLNGIKFDGCRESDGTMLEAKTSSFWFIDLAPFVFRRLKEYSKTMAQVQRQLVAARGRKIEWHFTDPKVAAFWSDEFRELNIPVKVRWTPLISTVAKVFSI